jgi:murein L,D-transpeptidase YafK
MPASALIIELKDVASDRVERQRAEAIGQLPLPGTPNIGLLPDRLAAKNMAMGNSILIRVFKASSELEVWMQRGGTFELFATYPICNWSGTLGPKLNEGDRQSPEGVYTVTSRQLHLIGRHPRSLNLGFPNALDRQMSRTGSYILIHGGCGSVGCFAMTNPVIEEVFSLASAALNKGKQDAVQVHVFPFRMTEDRLKAYSTNEWYDFWRNLKDVSDSFERTHMPPRVTICEGRYWVEDGANTEEVASHGPLAVCATSRAEVASLKDPDAASQEAAQPWWPLRAMVPPSLVPSRPSAPMVHSPRERIAAVLSSVQRTVVVVDPPKPRRPVKRVAQVAVSDDDSAEDKPVRRSSRRARAAKAAAASVEDTLQPEPR